MEGENDLELLILSSESLCQGMNLVKGMQVERQVGGGGGNGTQQCYWGALFSEKEPRVGLGFTLGAWLSSWS